MSQANRNSLIPAVSGLGATPALETADKAASCRNGAAEASPCPGWWRSCPCTPPRISATPAPPTAACLQSPPRGPAACCCAAGTAAPDAWTAPPSRHLGRLINIKHISERNAYKGRKVKTPREICREIEKKCKTPTLSQQQLVELNKLWHFTQGRTFHTMCSLAVQKSLAQTQGWCWERKIFVFVQAAHPASPLPTLSFWTGITYCEGVPVHRDRIVQATRRWTEAPMQGWMPYNTRRHIMKRAWTEIQIKRAHTHTEVQPGTRGAIHRVKESRFNRRSCKIYRPPFTRVHVDRSTKKKKIHCPLSPGNALRQ